MPCFNVYVHLKKFLVIQSAFIGDVILATAVLEKLNAHYPDAEIDFLVRKGNESLMKEHPFVHETLVWDKKEGKYTNLFLLLKKIRTRQYDVVINLQRFAASGILTAFSKAKERIGFKKNPFSFMFDKVLIHSIGNRTATGMHEVNRCLALVEHLTDGESQMPHLYPTDEDWDKIKEYTSEPFITISPASVWFTKQTPKDVWINFMKSIPEIKIYLLGGAGDTALCEKILKESGQKKTEILAGKLSLLQSAALMSEAQMNYTNDSAPMHLCSAMNAPVTAVFCSTIPEFGFGPLSEKSFIVESNQQLDCRPCGLHGYSKCPKGHFKCGQIDKQDLREIIAFKKFISL